MIRVSKLRFKVEDWQYYYLGILYQKLSSLKFLLDIVACSWEDVLSNSGEVGPKTKRDHVFQLPS